MFFQQLRKNFSDLLATSTAYGVPKIVLSKRLFLKFFWTVFLLLSSSASVVFVKDNIDFYFEYEVITKIESIFKQPLVFPTVTFCPYNNGAFDNRSIKDIISGCYFNSDDKCMKNPEELFEKFTSSFGTCYRFNSGRNLSGFSGFPILISTIGGRDDSLIMYLKNVSIGIQVWIHDQSSPPQFDYLKDYEGSMFYVPNNCHSQIGIHKIVDEKLGLPYNMCYKDVNEFPYDKTIINYIRNFTKTIYKQKNCLELCYDIDYLDRNPCNCTNSSLGNVWSDCWRKSEKKNSSSCTFNDRKEFFKGSVIEKCRRYCPIECDSVSYSVEVNNLPIENALKLRVYYQSLKYTSITQIPKTKVFDLISNIGGTLGLFIGVSFVTLFEFGELLIECFFLIFETRKSKLPFI